MYRVLYRKWRPQTFEEVYGQPHITATLKNELVSGRVAHAYLFTGSRGTGKTTCAKILAGDIAHINISHRGDVAALCLLVRLIREVDAHHGLTALADGNIADIDILGDTSAAGIGLDAEHAVEIRRVHLTVLSKDILHSAGDFGTYNDAAVAFVSLPVIAIYLMRTRYPEKIIFYCTRKLSYTTRRNCYIWYQQFKKAAIVMGKNPLMVLRAFIESGLSLLFIYATVPAYMTGLNIDFDLIQVMGRMVLINLVLYFSPTPGGSGIAEAGFVMLFDNLLPGGLEGIFAVLWRFTAEYLPFMLGAVVTIRAFGSDVINLAQVKAKNKVVPPKNKA